MLRITPRNIGFMLVMSGWILSASHTRAQQSTALDTTQIYEIPEVTVTEQHSRQENRSSSPLQTLSADDMKQLNVLQVSDAVKHFSGVTVKDYGGVGGLKTVSARSLGANHTAVSYDGVLVSDVQTGQIDIGRFSLDNIEQVSLSNGQSDNIFQPARAFSAGSVLNLRSRKPYFEDGKKINGNAGIRAGSFGLINPSLYLESKIGEKYSALFSGEYLYTNGEYPFTFRYGNTENFLEQKETRRNTDVTNLRLEGGIYGHFSDKSDGYLKLYYYGSERGLPGAIIFYNYDQYAGQRTWDNTFFAQAHFQHRFSDKIYAQFNGKYNWNSMRYVDSKALNGAVDNHYSQQEYYLSGSLLYYALDGLSFSLSTDGAINSMWSDLADFAFPMRYSWISSLAGKYVHKRFTAIASLLATVVNETVKQGDTADNHRRLSPYVSVSVKPFLNQHFYVRAFYKNIFRLPTFNDLYYNQVGNTRLKPETVHQYNLGITYQTSAGRYFPLLSLTADVYHNDVYDKIIAQPKQSTFLWSMVNYGKVAIDGMDVTAEVQAKPFEKLRLLASTSYTYQRALNVTDPTRKGEYKHQIPYTPRVSGSTRGGIETPWINIYYSLVWSGHRYTMKQNYAENRLPGYADHSISASHDFKLSFGTLSVNAEVLNLTNKNYEIIQWFPMPGRSYRAAVSLKF